MLLALYKYNSTFDAICYISAVEWDCQYVGIYRQADTRSGHAGLLGVHPCVRRCPARYGFVEAVENGNDALLLSEGRKIFPDRLDRRCRRLPWRAVWVRPISTAGRVQGRAGHQGMPCGKERAQWPWSSSMEEISKKEERNAQDRRYAPLSADSQPAAHCSSTISPYTPMARSRVGVPPGLADGAGSVGAVR